MLLSRDTASSKKLVGSAPMQNTTSFVSSLSIFIGLFSACADKLLRLDKPEREVRNIMSTSRVVSGKVVR